MAMAWRAKWKFDAAEYKKAADTEKLAAAAEAAFEAVIKDYADCPRLMREGAAEAWRGSETGVYSNCVTCASENPRRTSSRRAWTGRSSSSRIIAARSRS